MQVLYIIMMTIFITCIIRNFMRHFTFHKVPKCYIHIYDTSTWKVLYLPSIFMYLVLNHVIYVRVIIFSNMCMKSHHLHINCLYCTYLMYTDFFFMVLKPCTGANIVRLFYLHVFNRFADFKRWNFYIPYLVFQYLLIYINVFKAMSKLGHSIHVIAL